jgi:hypothetical protein
MVMEGVEKSANSNRSALKQQLNPTEGGVEKLAGKARRRVMPRHGEEEQRRQAASPTRQRAGSVLTQMVSVIEADDISLHETSQGLWSGLLLFQGSVPPHTTRSGFPCSPMSLLLGLRWNPA